MVVDNLEFNIRRTGSAGTSSINKLSTSIKKLGNTAKSSTSKLSTFISSLKRIAFYRILRTIIKEISEAFSEGLNNVYAYSSTIGSSISEALDSISSSSLTMKNQLGAALGELIVTVRPILEALISLITKVADALSQLFAALGGRLVYHKATDSVQKWSDAASNAADSAKEWKNQLMGFDEINRLDDTSSDSGNNGSSNNTGNWELTPLTIDFSWLDKYKIATTEWLKDLDLEPLKNAISTLMTEVSEFIQLVDSGLYWAYTNVLLPLAKWVIEEAGPASVELLASMLNYLNEVLENVLGPVFAKFFDDYIKPLASYMGDDFVFVVEKLTNAFNWLAEHIEGARSTLSGFFDFIINGISPIGFFVSAIKNIITIGEALKRSWSYIVEELKKVWEALYNNGSNCFKLLGIDIDGFYEGVKSNVQAILDVFEGIIEFVKVGFSGDWDTAWSGIYETFKTAINEMFPWLTGLIDGIKEAISWLQDLWEGVKTVFSNKKLTINTDGGTDSGQYATGGFPDTGQLFVAREAGPEMVGTINGRTAVANNDQIVEAISAGTYEAVLSAMSQINNGSDRAVNIYLDGRQIATTTMRYSTQFARASGI